jgi:ATP adenylyltransferase
MAYIEQASGRSSPPPTECFLCAYPAQASAHDRANLVLHREARAYVLLNRYPYNSGHLLVAPYLHSGDLARLPEADASALFALVQRSVDALYAVYQPDGYNVGMNLGVAAGAGVPDHLHVHVVPRWNGDTNFMPALGETKVLPESLEQTYDRLRPRF